MIPNRIHTPSEEEIAEACRRIREEWSEYTHRFRAGEREKDYEFPVTSARVEVEAA